MVLIASPLVVLVLALRALALDLEEDPAPSGAMNREPADPELKWKKPAPLAVADGPDHIDR
jgi:hypothetical protein